MKFNIPQEWCERMAKDEPSEATIPIRSHAMADYTDSVMTLGKAMEEIRTLQEQRLALLLALEKAERAAVPEGWLPIDSAPDDGTPHVRGLHVFSNDDGRLLYWDAYVGRIDTEDGIFYDLGGDVIGWEAMDFTHWRPLPPAPKLAGKEKG